MPSILLSIKPEYVGKILSGEKRYEFRRKLCKDEIDKIYIYATRPIQKVVAEVEVTGKLEGDKEKIWEQTKAFAGTDKCGYEKYFAGMATAGAYCLGNVTKYEVGKDLEAFGLSAGPRSFVYIKESEPEKTAVSLENFQDNYEKSLVWLLQYFEDSTLRANQPIVEDFIIDKIGNSDYLMEVLDWKLEQLYSLRIEENEEKRGRIRWNSTKGDLLKVHIVLNKIGKDLEGLTSFSNGIEALERFFGDCVLVNTGISSVLMNYIFDEGRQLDISEHFMPNLMIQEYSSVMRDKAFLKIEMEENHVDSEALKWSESVQLELDKSFLEAGIDFMKVQTTLLTLAESPLYSDSVREIAKSIAVLFKEMLVNSRILKIVIEPNFMDSEFEIGFKKSTKIEIFFSLENGDRFCLRLDFPHEGVPYIHYNLHEPLHATGLPIKFEEIEPMIGLCGSWENFKKLFFVYDNLCWFRWNFLEKLHEVFGGDSEQTDLLEKLFSEQCHYKIVGPEMGEEQVKEFLESFITGLNHMDMVNCIYERTGQIPIDDILAKIRIRELLHELVSAYHYLLIKEALRKSDLSGSEGCETGIVSRGIERLRQILVKGIRNNLDANEIQEIFGEDLEREAFKDIVDAIMVYVL